MNAQAYESLVTVSEQIGMPKSFRTDLTTHDRIALTGEGAPREFIWFVNECGTHLIRPDQPSNRCSYAGVIRTLVQLNPEGRFYHYLGQLREISSADAVRIVDGFDA